MALNAFLQQLCVLMGGPMQIHSQRASDERRGGMLVGRDDDMLVV